MLSISQDIVNQLTPYQNSLNTALDVMTSLPLVGEELSELQEWNTVFQNSVTSLASRVDALTNGHFELAIPLPSLSKTFTFDLGLDAFLQVKTSGGVSATINPVLNVGFDLTNGVPSLDPTHTGLDIGFVIGLPNFQLTASLKGLLYAQAIDDGTTFSGNLGFNFDTNFGIQSHFAGDAHVRLGLSLSLVDPALNASFNPRFFTDLELDWGFDTQGSQLKVPVIAFRNFSLDADSFMQGFLGDTVKGVQKFTKPMQPFIDMFEQPVPILSSFDSSETMGDLFLKGAGLSEAQQDSFNTMVKIVKAVNTFDFSGTTGGAVINFGDILLTGDARQTGQFFFDTTQLQGVIDDIMNSPALQEVQEKLEAVAEYVGFTADAGFKYPLLENPGPVIGSLLTGQTEVMFSYSTGRQHFELGASLGVGIPGLLGVFLNAGIVFDASLSVGYDTAGLLKFIQDPLKRPEDLLHGFYIDNAIDHSGPPIPNVPNPRKTSLYLQGHADVSASAGVTVSGGLYADIAFELASNSVSTHVYLDDIITSLSNNVKVFNPSGRLYAAANIGLTIPIPIGPDITVFNYQLSYKELLSFNIPRPPTPSLPLTVIDVTNQHSLLLDVTKMTAGGTVKVQPFHDYPITSGIGYVGDGIRVDYPNEIVMYVERKNDITTNYYNFVGLSGAVPNGVSIDIVDPFTVFTTEGAPDPQPPQTESGVLLAGGSSVIYRYTESPGGSLAKVLLVGGYGSNSLTGGTMAFGNFVPAARISEAKNHFGNITGFDAAGQAYINARVDSVLAPVSPSGIIGSTMTGGRGGLMFGGPGNNSFFATGPGAYEMVGGAWTNNFTISPSFNGAPATYQIDGGPFGQSSLVVRVPSTENVVFENSTIDDKYTPGLKALAVTANAGLSATAHGIQKVQIVSQPGASITIGDTSLLNIAFSILGGAELTFGGTNAPDDFSVITSGPFHGLANHYSPDRIGQQIGGNYIRFTEWGVPFPLADPVYEVTRTFGTNGRTQTIPFAVRNASASSIRLNAGGASDTYAINLGLGAFIDVAINDTDASTVNALTVSTTDTNMMHHQLTFTDNSVQLDYYTVSYLWSSFSGPTWMSSVHYTPTVTFGANVAPTVRTAIPFANTTINRPTGSQAAQLVIGGPSTTSFNPYWGLGIFVGAWDISTDPWTKIPVTEFGKVRVDIVANGGTMLVQQNITNAVPNLNPKLTFNVLGNAGTLSVINSSNLIWSQGLTLNVMANAGTINVQESAIGMPVQPTVPSLQMNVGASGTLANIHGAMNLTTPKGLVSLKIDDSTNSGPGASWTVDAMKTVIGDLTINYAGLNTAPFYIDNISTYQAFPKSGQLVNYNANPPFKVRQFNGLTLASFSISGNTQFQLAGVPNSVQLVATAPPNTPLTYSATGLPPGLTVNPTTGLITGVIAPQAYLAGFFNATISVTSGGAVVRTASSTMRWNVFSGIEIRIPNEFEFVKGLEGAPLLDLPLTAINYFDRPVTLTATGLPPGITFNSSTAGFTGAFALGSAQNGPYHVTIHATDGFETADTTFDWYVTGITLTVPNQLSRFGDVVDFLVQATTSTGAVPVLTVTDLPAGLSFNPTTRRVTGTVSATASSSNLVLVTATNGADVAEVPFTWTVLPVGVANYVSLNNPGNQFLHEGEFVYLQIQRPYNSLGLPLNYSATGLPPGMLLGSDDGANYLWGAIQAGAAANSPYHVQLHVTDGIWSDTVTFDISVAVPGSVSFGQSPNYEQYSTKDDIIGFTVHATSTLNETITYSATGLPPGITIDPQTGSISGYPTPLSALPGLFQVKVTATAASGSDSVEFLWHVLGSREASNVLALPHPSGTGFVTITSPLGTEISASISPQAGVALPNGVSFPFGFVTFAVRGLTPGQAADVTIKGLNAANTPQYYKYGATPANATDHWYNFLFGQATDGDSAVGTGMEIVGGNIVLHLIDGGRGDDDTTKNGIIFDIGGPAVSTTGNTFSTVTSLNSDHAAGSTYGQLVHFTATVSAASGTPTGSVQFKVDGQNFGSPKPLSGGTASLDISALSAVDHAITALYDSDTSAFEDSNDDFTQHVDRAVLTVIAANKTKVYGAALPALTASYSGFVNSETPAVLSTPPTISTTATVASHVGNYSIIVSGAVAANYTFSYQAGTMSVTPATLTIKADNKTKLYGAGLPTFTASYTGFVNGDLAASLTTQPTFSTAATSASHVANYTITAAGAVDADYTIGYQTGTLGVTPATLTIKADNKTKVYGAALPALTASVTGFVNGDTAAVLTTQPTLSTTVTTASHVANYAITAASAVAGSDYTISYQTGTLSVTPAPLTIKADNKTKLYGAGLPALTASYTGFVNGDTPTSLTTQPTLSTTATAASHVANYMITAAGAVDADYTISYQTGSLSVTPAPLTIKADNKTKLYGAGLPAFTASYTGFVNGDTPTSLTTQPTLSTTATAASHVANYMITAAGAVDADYTISYQTGSLSVTPAPLTIKADNKTKLYGAGLPAFTASYAGFVNGDTPASLTTQPTLSTTATTTSPVGDYPITATGAIDIDYVISYQQGTLSVTGTATSSISGAVYLDITGNGQSPDDTPSSGVKVYLDTNNNGAWNSGEPFATTAANGSYSFTGLGAGTYYVREVVPSGNIRTNPTLADNYKVTLASGQTVSGDNFANAALGNLAALSNVVYVVNGTTPVSDLRGNTKEGDTVQVSFTVVAGAAPQRYTLVSYTAPGAAYDPNKAAQQKIFDSDSGVFGPGTYSLTISNPHSYFQVDFVAGYAIDRFGPANSNSFYSNQNRLFSADNGGSRAVSASPAALSGSVYRDANNNGTFDSGELPLAGVKVTVNGGSTTQTVVTDTYGVYTFDNLPAGTYTITETQPVGYTDGKDTLGNKGGTAVNDKFSGIVLAANASGTGYNFGEQQTVAAAVAGNQTQTLAWWNGSNGQALIKAVNGGQAAKNLGNWLASNYNNLFGADAGSANNLTGKTNAQVAAYYQSLYANAARKPEAEALALALAVYVTNSGLAGSTATSYGFAVSAAGLSTATVNVGANGAAFGVKNDAVLTISELLSRSNLRARKGVLWDNNADASLNTAESILRAQIVTLFDAINNT